jgi:hypothetical protein
VNRHVRVLMRSVRRPCDVALIGLTLCGPAPALAQPAPSRWASSNIQAAAGAEHLWLAQVQGAQTQLYHRTIATPFAPGPS